MREYFLFSLQLERGNWLFIGPTYFVNELLRNKMCQRIQINFRPGESNSCLMGPFVPNNGRLKPRGICQGLFGSLVVNINNVIYSFFFLCVGSAHNPSPEENHMSEIRTDRDHHMEKQNAIFRNKIKQKQCSCSARKGC